MDKILNIIVPCYNEEEVLPKTAKELLKIVEGLIKNSFISEHSRVVFVDDGSKDKTWSIIEDLSKNRCIAGIKLSKNYGHQNAVLAGLFDTKADMYITIDADLQDDIKSIIQMTKDFSEGYDVVYGVRKRRDSDTFFKRFSAEIFYKLMKFFGVDIVYNHADFRLMSKRAVEALKEFKEVNLFLRGIVPLIGFRSKKVYYDRKEREAGESKYPLKKMLSFAWQGITSFSAVPLKLISFIGFMIFLFSLFMGLWVLYIKLCTDRAIGGWASIVLPIYFIGGIQLLSIGIIGEYVGKIYQETKQRPRYFIEKLSL